MLDAADLRVETGGRSKDRRRYRGVERPPRQGYRALRNRAIIYALVETGMRRGAATKLNIDDVHIKQKTISVEEKGGATHGYSISHEGRQAIRDYVERERAADAKKWNSPALFLSPVTNPHGDGRLTVKVINDVSNEVARMAGVEGKTPHSARHAMGKHIMKKTGNVAAVQRQLGHKNAAYSLQYARLTFEEMADILTAFRGYRNGTAHARKISVGRGTISGPFTWRATVWRPSA